MILVEFCHLLACWFTEPISSTLKMEAICSSETSVETQRTTLRHIPEDDTLDFSGSFLYRVQTISMKRFMGCIGKSSYGRT
jgi:hypothetical protein